MCRATGNAWRGFLLIVGRSGGYLFDEAHKDIVPASDAASIADTYAVPAPLNASDSITAPVLLLVGQEDLIFCTLPNTLDCTSGATILADEAPFYASTSSLTGEVVPATAHDVALPPRPTRRSP
ncbi:MAG: hypothetical protein QOJ54_2 [Aliidongia sp.]|jgi:hypothetical protein|nr:hypothetical protein [Aliidongia sp.]